MIKLLAHFNTSNALISGGAVSVFNLYPAIIDKFRGIKFVRAKNIFYMYILNKKRSKRIW